MTRELHAIRAALYGDTNPETLRDATNIGSILINMGRASEAVAYIREIMPKVKRVYRPGDKNFLNLRHAYARALLLNEKRNRGDFAEARTIVEEDLRTTRQVYGPSHSNTLTLEKMREDLISLTECYESSTRNGGRGFDDFEAFADHIVNATSADAIEDDPDEEAEELLQGLKNLLTNSGGA